VERSALVSALAEQVLGKQSPGAFRRVGVDGVDGAGKTWLADELAAAVHDRGAPVERVSIDGFHNPRDVRYRRGRDSPDGFFRDSYDYESFVSLVLRPFSQGGDGAYVPAIHDVREERAVSSPRRQAAAGSVLIVDGIFLHRDELAPFWDYSIWLDVPFEVSVPRGAARGDGFGSSDPAAPSNRRYVDGQRICLRECRPQERASVVVDNTDLDEPFIVEPRAVRTPPRCPGPV